MYVTTVTKNVTVMVPSLIIIYTVSC